MGELALKNPHGLQVGQKLILVRHGEPEEIEITKIGRQWATVIYGRWGDTARISLNNLSPHSSDRMYGRVYLSKERHAEIEAAERAKHHFEECWREFCQKVSWYRRPDGLTLEALQTAANALGIELPAPPHKEADGK